MENPRSVLIKKVLSQGPLSIDNLVAKLYLDFPAEFDKVSKTKIKKVYLKNLKNFGHVRPIILRDAPTENVSTENSVASEANVEESNAVAGKKGKKQKVKKAQGVGALKENWAWSLNSSLVEKYKNMNIEDARIPSGVILDRINKERLKSKDFWTGKTDLPHDWKDQLTKKGQKTSLYD
ncbi:hypothetical protein AYI68_g2773 [Smittium mucronatum]|uniref:Uncharacterized protein n=1 Tax=Smittium mucronatum TaxID=133383 RepID=A0A1R0H1T5_9FUNG|nr:hypothetical protein AYI68_g2773 [Smittium mucronatum]